jgi:acid phosphatase type 7
VAFAVLPPAASQARVRLAASPARAQPGAAVKVRGSGFPKRARVVLFLGGKRVRSLRAGRRGSFRTRFRVPRRRPRLYRLTARSGRIVVRLRFRLLRAPAKKPPPPPSTTPPATASSPPPPPPLPDPDLVAAGDIACAPPATPTSVTCHQGTTSDRVLALHPAAVALLGDDQYEHGELANFQSVFDPSWGRFKSITRPAIGNHEYLEDAQHDEAPGYFTYFDTAAGDPAKGYYSYTLKGWTVFVLNTGDLGFNSGPDDCFPVSCVVGSAQEQWLRTGLAALPDDACVLAYWHHPRFASDGPRAHAEVSPLYDALYDYGAELILTGHSHTYERFAPMDAAGTRDDSHGVREFVVGTGGRSRFPASPSAPNTEMLDTGHFGVLALNLGASGYDFRFVDEGGAVLDHGSGSCHGPHP